ncbi:hypothetical protein [Candidatus Darwinibacter acetoxidans]|jgi:hypothetical protein
MRRGFSLISLAIVLICLVSATPTASAQLLAGVQLSYGRANFEEVLGEEGAKTSQLLNTVWAHYDYEDLRFTGIYQGSLGLGGTSIGRHLGQVAANYRVLEEGPMQIYAGLGYHFTSTRFAKEMGGQENPFTLTGHGFAGQVVIDIEITEELRTSTTLTASPWVNWSFSSAGTTRSIDASGSFNAKLDLVYDYSDQLSVQIGLLGGSYKVLGFTHNDNELGETRGVFAGFSAGITQRF